MTHKSHVLRPVFFLPKGGNPKSDSSKFDYIKIIYDKCFTLKSPRFSVFMFSILLIQYNCSYNKIFDHKLLT